MMLFYHQIKPKKYYVRVVILYCIICNVVVQNKKICQKKKRL